MYKFIVYRGFHFATLLKCSKKNKEHFKTKLEGKSFCGSGNNILVKHLCSVSVNPFKQVNEKNNSTHSFQPLEVIEYISHVDINLPIDINQLYTSRQRSALTHGLELNIMF